MKKAGIILIALAAVLAVSLTGCGGTDTTSSTGGTSQTTSSGQETSAAQEGYVFKTGGVTIAMHAEIAPILEKLGKEKSYFEAESCAFQGIEKTYTYSSFSICTYELDRVDRVASLLFLDDSIETPEGVSLFATLDDVVAAYGDQYVKSLGLYTYETPKMKLSFLIEEGKVASIEYLAKAE